MDLTKKINILSMIAALVAIISAIIGLFYTTGGTIRVVENIYGQKIQLYGDGIYANDELLKVGTTKGTDAVLLIFSVCLIILTMLVRKYKLCEVLQTGILAGVLYDAICIIMGVQFNRLYLVYLIWFAAALYAFILAMIRLGKTNYFSNEVYDIELKGTAIFLIVGGCSVLVWFIFIIPAVITGKPTDFIGIYTTEPTFCIDLGIILPGCVATGIGLLKKQKYAYPIASVLMTLITMVGICVISQTIFQLSMGIVIEIGQIIGLVVTFVILGGIAIWLNVRLLMRMRN